MVPRLHADLYGLFVDKSTEHYSGPSAEQGLSNSRYETCEEFDVVACTERTRHKGLEK